MSDTNKAAPVDEPAEGTEMGPETDSALGATSFATVVPRKAVSDDDGYRTALAVQRLARLVRRLEHPDVVAKLSADDRRLVRAAVGVIERALAR